MIQLVKHVTDYNNTGGNLANLIEIDYCKLEFQNDSVCRGKDW